ncbi:hypothetical protein IT417_03950 [bacterium]|nr:hypothetical protein [bacterium]
MKKEIKVIAVLFNSENKILLEKLNDEFMLPFSTINDRERIEDAYKRFLLNYTGLTIEMLGVIAAYNFDEINQISIVYACTPLYKFKPTKSLPDKYSWYSEEEIKIMKISFPYREMIAKAYFKP